MEFEIQVRRQQISRWISPAMRPLVSVTLSESEIVVEYREQTLGSAAARTFPENLRGMRGTGSS
jgi:hypothetical protein